MKYWKQLGVWAIALRAEPFRWARLKFTILFTLIIAIILIVYLGFLYSEFNRNIKIFADENIPEVDRRARFVVRSTKVTVRTLFGVEPEDIGILIITGIVSYFLAAFVLKPIRETMKQQEQFVTYASHELKTPLSIIRTEMEVFLRGKNYLGTNKRLMIRRRQSVQSNLEEVNRMGRIIENLLLVARIDAKYEKLQLSKVSLNDVISRVVVRMAKLARDKNISISINRPSPLYLLADEEKIIEAFSNILKNAIAYSKNGSRIKIEIGKRKDKVFISFGDEGVGISKYDLPHIFERFYRSKNAFTVKKEGTGLGLWITKRIVEEHNGRINIESVYGKRTTVNIVLPLSS